MLHIRCSAVADRFAAEVAAFEFTMLEQSGIEFHCIELHCIELRRTQLVVRPLALSEPLRLPGAKQLRERRLERRPARQ